MPPTRNLYVFGPHKVGTKTMQATLRSIPGCQAFRSHNHHDIRKNWKFKAGDVVFTGIRDPTTLRFSAFFQDLTSRFIPNTTLEELTPDRVAAEFKKVDWDKYGFVNLDAYMQTLSDVFDVDPRKITWERPEFVSVETRRGIRVIVYQVEKLTQSVLNDMLLSASLPSVSMVLQNEARSKPYKNLYIQTRKLVDLGECRLPWYVKKIMSSEK